MTALAGLWRFDGRLDAAEQCSRMLTSQEIYGPHGSAQRSDDGIALGRRLMRVLPEDKFDSQPLIGGGGRYVLVADLRLDNRDELIDVLGIPTDKARQSSDAAILLAAIERWGDLCFDHIVGDYAFALWNGANHRLMMARDPLGQRPLHYHSGDGFFAFASMPKGLHALAEVPYAPDEDRVAEFLVLMPETSSKSFFRGVDRVLPGHLVIITSTGLTMRRHWQPSGRRISLRRAEDYCDGLRELFDQAVSCRLRGLGDVGTHLSGGIDSGAVTATAARLLASSKRRVVAFTAAAREGYDGPVPRNRFLDEASYAAATAALYPNIQHVVVRNGGRSPLDDLDKLFLLWERPVLNICGMAVTKGINDAVRQRKLTVLLTGTAGNFGMSYNGLELLPELVRSGRWLRLGREAKALVSSKGGMNWRGVLANTFGAWFPAHLWLWLHRIVDPNNVPKVSEYSAINSRRLAELDFRDRDLDPLYRPWKDGVSMRLWALRRFDPGNHNKGILGGWQIDERDPTADIRLLEFCLSVPTEQFLSNGAQRALARRAFADRLPRLVVDERRKGLADADWHERVAAAADEIALEIERLDGCGPATRALDICRLRKLAEDWLAGGVRHDRDEAAHRLALMRGISVGHFLRRTTGANL